MAGMMLARKPVAVVGATGFIGSHLVERLDRDGAEVLAIGRTLESAGKLVGASDRVCYEAADVEDEVRLLDLFRRYQPGCVYHLAAEPDGKDTVEHARKCIEVNTLGTLNVLRAAMMAGAGVFVFGDSSKVYGNTELPLRSSTSPNPICSYAIAKSAAWQLCRTLAAGGSTRVVSLRPNFVYGAGQGWNLMEYVLDCIRKGKPVELMGGTQTRDPIYIDDVVEAFLMAAERPEAAGRAIPVGGGCEMSVADMCRVILRVAGVGVRLQVGAQPSRSSEIWRTFADIEDSREILGWLPKTDFATGVALTLESKRSREAASVRALRAAV